VLLFTLLTSRVVFSERQLPLLVASISGAYQVSAPPLSSRRARPEIVIIAGVEPCTRRLSCGMRPANLRCQEICTAPWLARRCRRRK
jgi:hypothetical protein